MATAVLPPKRRNMKEIYTNLYPNEAVAKKVADYSFAHSTPLPKHISDFHAWGNASQERADFMISPLQAQFQMWMTRAMGAKRGGFLRFLYVVSLKNLLLT